MGKIDVEIRKLRKELNEKGFFEDVIFDKNCRTQNDFEQDGGITRWVYYLKQYRGIELEKFKDLFIKLDEVKFPITITETYGDKSTVDIIFRDKKGNRFYLMNKHAMYAPFLNQFSIGRRNSAIEPFIDRTNDYKIIEGGRIVHTKTVIMKLNEKGINTDEVIEFVYDAFGTKATIKYDNDYKKIAVEYQTKGAEVDEKVKEVLFNIYDEDKTVFYDVKKLLVKMLEIIDKENVSIYIGAFLDGEVYAEVSIEKNKVNKYTRTEIINEGEMCRTTRIFSKTLDRFLK